MSWSIDEPWLGVTTHAIRLSRDCMQGGRTERFRPLGPPYERMLQARIGTRKAEMGHHLHTLSVSPTLLASSPPYPSQIQISGASQTRPEWAPRLRRFAQCLRIVAALEAMTSCFGTTNLLPWSKRSQGKYPGYAGCEEYFRCGGLGGGYLTAPRGLIIHHRPPASGSSKGKSPCEKIPSQFSSSQNLGP